MKHFLLSIAAFFLAAACYAQADTVYVWNKWCARKDTLLLFTAGNNVIQVYCPGIKPDNLKLKSLDAAALRIGKPEIKGDTVSVLAMPYPAKSRNKNMRLAIAHKKTGKIIRTVNFNCDTIPKLVARLGKLQGSEALRKDILNQTSIQCIFPNSLYSYPYRIRQFIFRATTPSSVATLPVSGIFLSTNIMQQIKDAPVGTVIQFTDIKATCPDCAVRTLDDIRMKIK